jgi:hypothetical protein
MTKAATHLRLSEDAALVTALAGTALAFSHCAEDEAERWLRALRPHGQVGCVLQALGVGESPLETSGDRRETAAPKAPLGQAAFDRAVLDAERHAIGRGAETIGTADLLIALFGVYGETLDQALDARGTSRREVLDRLEMRDQARTTYPAPPLRS